MQIHTFMDFLTIHNGFKPTIHNSIEALRPRLKHTKENPWFLMPPHLVVKVCFCSSLRHQAKLAIGHLLSIVPETSYGHGQYQHGTYDCHGKKGDDGPTGALGNPGNLRETPCICPLGKKTGE